MPCCPLLRWSGWEVRRSRTSPAVPKRRSGPSRPITGIEIGEDVNHTGPGGARARSARHWYEQGEEPDYRFSLANERTLLAWVRTGLALLAGSVAVAQLSPTTSRGGFGTLLGLLLAVGAIDLRGCECPGDH
ncbi:DUF202 domain-containing protein [Streptomyces albiflaviniger]|nr:DUF202 domain-containing protein [Streptomyces albiflaviniger]